jgi:hypothetical protein
MSALAAESAIDDLAAKWQDIHSTKASSTEKAAVATCTINENMSDVRNSYEMHMQ